MKLPKYQQIFKDLQRQIETGEFENGDKFYTEQEITHLYSVSTITAIRALNELASSGYIVRKQGKGSFVSRSKQHKQISFSTIVPFETGTDKVSVLSMTEGNDNHILEKLNLSQKDTYVCITRIREVNGVPFAYHKTYIPKQFVRNDVKISYYTSIYDRFKQDFDIQLENQFSRETNEMLFPAPKEAIEALNLQKKEPVVLQVKTTQSTLSKRVYEYAETYKRWDYFKIELLSNEQ